MRRVDVPDHPCVAARLAAETTTTNPPGSSIVAAPSDGAGVVEVVDGDTLVVEIASERERLRLVGVNAPERGDCLADDASRWLRGRVEGREVELVVDRSDRDRYGRLLRHVEVNGADVGGELVRAGLALARRYPPDTARADEYERLQAEAQAAGVGLWAADACGPAAAGGDIAITEVRCGADSATDLHWCNEGSAVWNNSGDTAFLLDPSGSVVHSMAG